LSEIGLRRSRGGRDDLPLTADINVTSLVDVAFTLLVIFIITAPILQGGIDVNLPQADVRPVTAMEDLFIVSIDPRGGVFVEETEITIEEFESSFAQLAAGAGTEQVFLRVDKAAVWDNAYRVMAAVQAAGVALSIIGEPRPPAPRR